MELDVLLDLSIRFSFCAVFFAFPALGLSCSWPFLLLAFPVFAFVDSLAFGHFACLFSFVVLLLFFSLLLPLLLSHFHDQNHNNNNEIIIIINDDINNPPHPSSSSSYSSSSRMTTTRGRR